MFKLMIVGRDPQELKRKMTEFAAAIVDGADDVPATEGLQRTDRQVAKSVQLERPLTRTATETEKLMSEQFATSQQVSEAEVAAPQPTKVSETLPKAPRFPLTPEANDATDSRGVPWIESVHSSSKIKNQDGTWRGKRGVHASEIARIEAEAMAAAKFGAQAPAQPIPQAPQVAATAATAPAVPQGNVVQFVGAGQTSPAPVATPFAAPPVIASAPVQPAVAQPAPAASVAVAAQPAYENIPIPAGQRPAHTLETFKINFVPTMSKLLQEGKLTQEYVEQLNKYFKVEQFWDLAKNDTALGELFATFVAAGLITKVG